MASLAPALSVPLRHRLVRFLLTGGVCALAQLLLLLLFTRRGFAPLPANIVAFALSAHLNFAASAAFTWGDRRGGPLLARWLAFLGAVSGTALLNLAVFEAARATLPVLPAAASGIAVAAVINYLVADRAIFTTRATGPAPARSLDPDPVPGVHARYSWRRP